MAKILGIDGSHRPGSNSRALLEAALKAARDKGCEYGIISLYDKKIEPCKECSAGCGERCIISDDATIILRKIAESDAVIIASPVFFGSVSGLLKNLFDRSLYHRRKGFQFKDRVCGAITCGGSRNGGQDLVLHQIISWALIHDMVVVGDGEPTAHFGGVGVSRNQGEAARDEAGIKTAQGLGKRVAEITLKLRK